MRTDVYRGVSGETCEAEPVWLWLILVSFNRTEETKGGAVKLVHR